MATVDRLADPAGLSHARRTVRQVADSTRQIMYRAGDSRSNRILRLALLKVWERCHWCSEPRQYSEVEIDHLIPRAGSPKERDLLIEELVGPAYVEGYNLDAPRNLAPICKVRCNREKSNNIYEGTRLLETLRRAAKEVPNVEQFVRRYWAAGKFADALATAVEGDLADDRNLDALTDFAPLLDARIRLIDFTTNEEVVDPMADDPRAVTLKLDRKGRQVRDVLEVLTGRDFDEAILEPIRTVRHEITERLLADITAQVRDAGHPYPDVAWPTARIDLNCTELRYLVDEEQFKMVGAFDADGTAEASVMAADGDGLETLQREASGHGTFGVMFWFERKVIESGDLAYLEWNDGPDPAGWPALPSEKWSGC